MSVTKEPSYFVEPADLRAIWFGGWLVETEFWRSEKNYLELSQQAGTATILGEASIFYTYVPLAAGVTERLYKFNSNARSSILCAIQI
jgi:hypothetical protein